ncbi:hypothetical protein ACNHKD_03700 [Methylocystis sp. JAN1]|uniref:hypothetical protein n=1 Tax=Methylocystis sp. JAN1 TaxID=3397211 RepID=UPI003FA1C2B7
MPVFLDIEVDDALALSVQTDLRWKAGGVVLSRRSRAWRRSSRQRMFGKAEISQKQPHP